MQSSPKKFLATSYLSTRLAATQFPKETQSQRRNSSFLGERGQGGRHKGQKQRERWSGALAVGTVREKRRQSQQTGEKVRTTDHTGHCLAVNRMSGEQEAGDRVAEVVSSRQYLQNARNSRGESLDNGCWDRVLLSFIVPGERFSAPVFTIGDNELVSRRENRNRSGLTLLLDDFC